MDLNPNATAISEVRDKLRQAFHKLILYPELNESLVQFWAPTTEALEGRTLLSTQNQPFALGKTSDKLGLCEYRMISKECKFYVDRKSGEQEEEQLGLPGRVFLYQLHESAPNVEHYSVNEYPQRHLGSHCPIKAAWAVPVFEHSSQTCVGVLELVSSMENVAFWYRRSFLGNLDRVFQVCHRIENFHVLVTFITSFLLVLNPLLLFLACLRRNRLCFPFFKRMGQFIFLVLNCNTNV